MGKISYAILVLAFAAVVGLTYCKPTVLGDNRFIQNLADNQSLGILGVVIAIFLPTAATLYVRLSEIERQLRRSLKRTRAKIKYNCIEVVVLFVLTAGALMVKAWAGDVSWVASAANGIVLWVILSNLLVLVDLTNVMFKVGELPPLPPQQQAKPNDQSQASP